MRDPKRIEVILDHIRQVWEANPDLRLGQIVASAAQQTTGYTDTFYVEDIKLLAGLIEVYFKDLYIKD